MREAVTVRGVIGAQPSSSLQGLVELRASARRNCANHSLQARRAQRSGGVLCKRAQAIIRRDVNWRQVASIDARGVAL